MYGNIVILIVSFIIFIIALILVTMDIVGEKKFKESLEKYSTYLYNLIVDEDGVNWENIVKEEDRDAYNAWYKTAPTIVKFYTKINSIVFIILFCFLVVSSITFSVSLICSFCSCIAIPSDIARYRETYALYQELLENTNGLDVTSDMITMKMELNNWLLNAKIGLERWGFWSSYYPYAEEISQLAYLV